MKRSKLQGHKVCKKWSKFIVVFVCDWSSYQHKIGYNYKTFYSGLDLTTIKKNTWKIHRKDKEKIIKANDHKKIIK